MRFETVPARLEHAHSLAPRMRQEDRLEIMASGGFGPLDALLYALDHSSASYAVLIDHELTAIFGVAPLNPREGVGTAWMMTSSAIDRHWLTFLRHSKEQIARLLALYPVLINLVDARYETALRWAEWCGFEVGEPEPFGIHGLPFCKIRLERSAVCVSLSSSPA